MVRQDDELWCILQGKHQSKTTTGEDSIKHSCWLMSALIFIFRGLWPSGQHLRAFCSKHSDQMTQLWYSCEYRGHSVGMNHDVTLTMVTQSRPNVTPASALTTLPRVIHRRARGREQAVHQSNMIRLNFEANACKYSESMWL